MAQTHDTIDGLLAEFRGYSAGMPASYHVTMSWADFRKMLDRFDAAHKRDHEYPKAQSLDADKLTGKNISGLVTDLRQIAKYHYARGNIVQGQFTRVMADRIEAAHKREMSKNASKNGADFGQLGNAAKLREALEAIISGYENADLCDMNYGEWCHDPANVCVNVPLCKAIHEARAALAEPVKNCEVGTAEEQDERFHRFCVMQRKGSCAGCPDPVGGRTVANGIRECALVWAQMPYEEGGAK